MFEKDAKEYAEINKPFLNRYDCVCVFKDGAKFGYNKAKKEMQAQIEKMKCCGNCKYSAQETVYSIVCKVGGVNKGEIENVEDCLVCDKWEIKENDL